MQPRFPLLIAMALLGALGILSCSTVDSGRRSINLVSPEREKAMGLASFQKLKQEKRISRDPAMNDQLRRVGSRLSRVISMPDADWEFVVFDDPTPNAFALPGGKVGVHTGLFQVTQNEAGLAAVVGHEVAHVVFRHGAERVSRQMIAAAGGAALGIALNRNEEISDTKKTAVLGAYGAGVTAGAILPFSRKQELESDEAGAVYMARAGYHPRESVELWKRFAAFRQRSGGGSRIPFLSTHPTDASRIAALEAFMPQAMREYRP